MDERLLPIECPSCRAGLRVTRLVCPECGTSVEGEFGLPVLCRLGGEEQTLVLNFVKCGGNLKDLARVYGVSYPTVRNRLDALIRDVQRLEGVETKEV